MVADVPMSVARHELREALVGETVAFGLARLWDDTPEGSTSRGYGRVTSCSRLSAKRVRCEWRITLVCEGDVVSRTEGVADVTRRHGRLSVQPVDVARRGLT